MTGYPSSVTAGESFTSPVNDVTVTAQDIFENTKTNYTGTVSWTSSDGSATLPSNYTFVGGDNGAHAFTGSSFTLQTAGTQIITVTDVSAGMSENSDNITVNPAALNSFTMSGYPTAVTAGNDFGANNVTVTAYDQYNNVKTNYTGTVSWSSTDGSATLPSNYLFNGGDAGSHTFAGTQFTLNSEGTQTITVQDGGTSVSSSEITVSASNIASFTLTPSNTSVTAGTAITMTVSNARDAQNNLVDGVVTLSFSDAGSHNAPDGISPSLPTIQVVNGEGSTPVTLVLAESGVQIKGESGIAISTTAVITVSPAALAEFNLVQDIVGAKTAGASFGITGTAWDTYENTITSFNNTANLSDLTATLTPTTMTFSNGAGTQTASVNMARANNSITVNYNNKTGTTPAFDVVHAQLDHFLVTNTSDLNIGTQTAGQAFDIKIVARDVYNNTVTGHTGAGSEVNIALNIGTITPPTSGTFNNGVLASESVTITEAGNDRQINVSGSGKTGSSNLFTVNSGALSSLKIMDSAGGLGTEVLDTALTLEQQLTLYAAGYDANDNYIRDVVATWNRSGDLDLPSPLVGTSTVLDPVTPGTSGKISADTTSVTGDSTGTITVGEIAKVVIVDVNGIEIRNKTLTADDSLTLYAQGRDASNSPIGNVVVDWTSSGTLAPAIMTSGVSSITFSPTTATASGKIFAVHATASDDSTDTITVNPGVPVGTITLTAVPNTIPADDTSKSQITSSQILDFDSNPVGANRQFTVGLLPANLGQINTPDVNLVKDGLQIATNVNSELDFEFQADTLGGTVNIIVSSDSGSAEGNTQIAIGSMSILSITNAPLFVSQGQNVSNIEMVVKNLSPSTITNLGATLTFSGNTGFTPLKTDAFTTILPQGQRILTFDVSIGQSATLGTITIDGEVNGFIGTTPVSSTGAAVKDTFTVQVPAQLSVTSVTSAEDTVTIGELDTITVQIQNPAIAGAASVIIDNIQLKFIKDGFTDQSTHFDFSAISGNPTSVPAGQALDFLFKASAGATADIGNYELDVQVSGHDTNTVDIFFTNETALATGNWYVKGAPALQIMSLKPEPKDSWVAGDTTNWYVRMALQNSGPDDIKLDFSDSKTYIQFFSGITEVTGEYTILQPGQLAVSGTDTLKSGTTDTLDFTIDVTGSTEGTITITGQVEGLDVETGGTIADNTDSGGKGAISVFSQTTSIFITNTDPVTFNIIEEIGYVDTAQTFNIEVKVKNSLTQAVDSVKVELTSNNGQSTISSDTLTIPVIAIAGFGTANFSVTASLNPNPAGETFTARVLSGIGQKTQNQVPISTPFDSTAKVRIQETARLQVEFSQLDSFLTVGEIFQVDATVLNLGQAEVDNSGLLRLTVPSSYALLTNANQSFITNNAVQWQVQAPSSITVLDTFIVDILQVPVELNINAPATVETLADSQEVRTLDVGLVIDELAIVSPTGAMDDTISTGQRFHMQTKATFPQNIDSVRVEITELPGDYELFVGSDLSQKLTHDQNTALWQIDAADQAHQELPIKVRYRAYDSGQVKIDTTKQLGVVAVDKAIIHFENFQDNPSGVYTVSLNQDFTLRALFVNNGTADVEGAAELTLDLSNTGIISTEPLVQTFVPGTTVIWHVKAPSTITASQTISVKLTTNPMDENTNIQAANSGQLQRFLNVETANIGFVNINSVVVTSPSGAQDSTISTDQEFNVSAEIEWGDMVDLQAEIEFPPGTSYEVLDEDGDRFRSVSEGPLKTVGWRLKAPDNNLSQHYLTIKAKGNDINNQEIQIIAAPDSLPFTVVEKAQLNFNADIISPASAKDRVLTVGQLFTITANLTNRGDAGLAGEDSVQIIFPSGAAYSTGNPLTQMIAPGNPGSWTIKAPDTPTTILDIIVNIINHESHDENSNQLIPIDPSPPQKIISVSTEAIGLRASILTGKKPTTMSQEVRDKHLFGIKFENPSDSNIEIEYIKLNVKYKKGNALASIGPDSVFSKIAVGEYDNPGSVFGVVDPVPGVNPITINFNPEIAVAPSTSKSIEFRVDIAQQAAVNNFQLVIESPQNDISAINVDADTAVAILDSSGLEITSALNPGISVLVEPTLSASFFNYPNPFGQSDRPSTTFNYNLEEASDVSIQIYTLLGELVTSVSFTATDPEGQQGMHNGAGGLPTYVWDGKNGRGQTILNGVYVAVLITNYGKAMTKIAVAK